MNLAKIDLDKALNLEFELSIDGVKESVSEIRFVIEGEERSEFFNGSYKNGQFNVRIPPMENIVEAGERECYIEVIADGRYFKPMNESIEFIAPVKVASKNVAQKIDEQEIKIDVPVVAIVQEELKPVSKDSAYDSEQLEAGTKVEMEHTDDANEAEKIAKHHLDEDSGYYKKLQKVHNEAIDSSEPKTNRVFENHAVGRGFFLEESDKFVFSRDRSGGYTGAKNKSTERYSFFNEALENQSQAILRALIDIKNT